MAGTNMHELNRMIGTLIASTEGSKEDLRAIRHEMKESERASVESRRGMHRRLDEVIERTGHLENQMVTVKRDLGNVKSVTDKATMWEQRGIGALAMSGFAVSSLTFLLTYYWEQIMRLFTKV